MKYRKVAVIPLYTYTSQQLKIVSRGEDGKRYTFIKKQLPVYFYVDRKPDYDAPRMAKVKHINDGFTSVFGKPLWRVEIFKSFDMKTMTAGYNTYEADVYWPKKCCLDMKLTDGFQWKDGNPIIDNGVDNIKLRTWIIDIEVSAPTFDEAQFQNPKGITVCIIVYDSYMDDYFTFRLDKYNSEVEMFLDFARTMRIHDPDIITGWNIDYDISWIMARMKNLGMNINILSNHGKSDIRHWTGTDGTVRFRFTINGRVIFDGLQAYKSKKDASGQLSNYGLKSVATSEGYPTWTDFGGKIYQMWGKANDKIVEYCKEDVQATKFVLDKERLIELSLLICRFSGCTLDETTSKDKIVDSSILLKRGDQILPSKIYNDSSKQIPDEDVKGGAVIMPDHGMHYNVGVFDASKMYPAIIMEFNISPECLDDNGSIKITTLENDVYTFNNKKQGLLPQALNDFIKLRESFREEKRKASISYGEDSKEYKTAKEIETAVKTIATSFYGVMVFKNFRLFNLNCANAITGVGRIILETMKKELNKDGYNCVYGDTDSLMVKMNTYKNGNILSEKIKIIIYNTLTKMGVRGDGMEVKFEKFFKWIFFKRTKKKRFVYLPAKKKYVGHCTLSEGTDGNMKEDDYLYIRGFETRRSDSNVFMKNAMTKFFNLLKTDDLNVALKYIHTLRDDFYKLTWKELTWPKNITNLDYNSPWTRGVKYGMEHLKWRYDKNASPELLYIKGVPEGKPYAKEICVQENLELPQGYIVDYDIMFEKLIKKKFTPILESLGIDWEGRKQSSIEAFL